MRVACPLFALLFLFAPAAHAEPAKKPVGTPQKPAQILSAADFDKFAPETTAVLMGGDKLTDADIKTACDKFELVQIVIDSAPKVTDAGVNQIATETTLQALGIINCSGMKGQVGATLGALAKLATLQIAMAGWIKAPITEKIASIKTLTTLGLIACAGMKAEDYAPLKSCAALISLGIERCTDMDAAALTPFVALSSIKTLSFNSSWLRDEHFAALAGFKAVSMLSMTQSATITAERAVHIGKLTALEMLDLSGNSVDKDALVEIAKLPAVTRLGLAQCGLADASLAALADMKSLQLLVLNSNSITARGLKHLTGLANLKQLHVRQCDAITDAGMKEFKAALPKCEAWYFTAAKPSWRGAPGKSVVVTSLADAVLLPDDVKAVQVMALSPDAIIEELRHHPAVEELTVSVAWLYEGQISTIASFVQLKSLRLENANLAGPVVAKLGALVNLVKLEIAKDDQVTGASLEFLAKLEKLESLTISKCKNINGSRFELIGNLPALKRLELTELTLLHKEFASFTASKSLAELTLRNIPSPTYEIFDTLAKHTQLRKVRLIEGHYYDDCVARLAPLTQLEELEVSNLTTRATSKGLGDLASLPNLAVLTLKGDFKDGTIAPLAACPALRKLSMQGCYGITDALFEKLSTSKTLATLEVSGSFTDVCISYLARMQALEELDLSHFGGAAEGVGALAASGKLKSLNLSFCAKFNLKAAEALGKLTTLKSLTLAYVGTLNDDMLAHIAKLTALEHLDLADCQGIRDKGVAYLAALTELRTVNLSNDYELKAESVEVFKQWKKLKEITLRNTTIGAVAYEELPKALPGVVVKY
ncbi:MAG: hypothetical protein IT462_06020 [Planctomycetes bacterium]|nr:hypothetical protein [Planctomycetota bacterium]